MISQTLHAKAEIINSTDINKKIFKYSVWALMSVVLLYMYFVATATFDVVARKTAEKDLQALKAQVGILELEYLAKENNIDLAYAETLGFKEVSANHFAKRGSFAFKTSQE